MRRMYAAVMVAMLGAVAALGAQEGIANQKQVSPMDYVQILQLYARYSHAVDLVIDDGSAYAANFAEDGVLKFANNEVKGRKAIKAWARKDDKPRPVRGKGWRAGHTMTNFEAIELAPGTARVIAYFHEGERVAEVEVAGVVEFARGSLHRWKHGTEAHFGNAVIRYPTGKGAFA